MSSLGLSGEFAGLVSEECAFDEGSDVLLFVGVELVDGFEVDGEVGVGASVVVGEDESICAY